MNGSMHISKWDSPLIIFELISRDEIGTLLCKTPPFTLFEKYPEWLINNASLGNDNELFNSSLNYMIDNNYRISIMSDETFRFIKNQKIDKLLFCWKKHELCTVKMLSLMHGMLTWNEKIRFNIDQLLIIHGLVFIIINIRIESKKIQKFKNSKTTYFKNETKVI